MTPKSLLRASFSSLAEFASGTFQRVLPDAQSVAPANIKKILLCSGKVYFDLLKRRAELERDDVSILRLEQLYPLPDQPLKDHLSVYAEGTPVTFVQEEPENMGAWRFLRVLWGENLFGKYPFDGIYRPASASPATGSHTSHDIEQDEILTKAIGPSAKSRAAH
jgi:2-oxoglutarate dehydrogenase E1 component